MPTSGLFKINTELVIRTKETLRSVEQVDTPSISKVWITFDRQMILLRNRRGFY